MILYNNRYEKIRPLGRGMTGEVTLVKDQKTGFSHALKVLHARLGHVKRFELEALRREFQTLKNLNHPSIAKVYDTGLNSEDEKFYLVSEFIDGKDLFEGTEQASLEVIEDLFVQALRALNYLHSQKVNHFDIKPNNILVTKDKEGVLRIKIIDFGFANFYEQEIAKARNMETLPIVGTPAYMAPEIIKKEPHDQRADLYSLACSFYKAFTRQLPFRGSQDEVYQKQLSEQPSPLSKITPSIPAYLDHIFLKLLEKDPEKRYFSAQEVIKDLNIQANKDYEVETFETAISYLPQKGHLIGREKEFEKFKEYFDNRRYTMKKKPYLIIHGPKGTGKTRFLEECKNEASQHFIQVLTSEEASNYSLDQIPTPSLAIGDDLVIEKHTIDYHEICLQDVATLSVWTTSQKQIPCDAENIIELHNFSLEQTEEYLLKSMGLSSISSKDLDDIFKITSGNPLYLSGVVRILFKNRKIRDGHGNWSQKIYEDLGLNLEETGVEEFIKKSLREELEALNLELGHSQILNMLALTGKPTLNDLQSMSGNFSVDEALVRLAAVGILKVDAENLYVFTNPLYKEIILEKMDPQDRQEYCDMIADYYESQQASREIILYFRGRGAHSSSANSLIELAKIQRERSAYHLARENLELILNKADTDLHVTNMALLELGEIEIETGKYPESQKWLEQITQLGEGKVELLTFVKAIEQLGVGHYKRGQIDSASSYYQQGLGLIRNYPDYQWMEVILKNRIARNELDKGNLALSEQLFLEAWNIWKNKLSAEDKIKSTRCDIDLLYQAKGEYGKAVGYLEEYLKIASQKSHEDIYPILLLKLGRIYLEMKDLTKSEPLLINSLQVIKNRHTPHILYAIYHELGRLYETKGQLADALSSYQHAFDLAQKTALPVHVYIVAFNIANIFLQQNKYEEAKKYYDFVLTHLRASETTDETSQGTHLYLSLLGLSETSRRQNNLSAADSFLKQAFERLNASPYLESFKQYYWQEKADMGKNLKHTDTLEEALRELDILKTKESFNKQEFEKWQKNFKSSS